MFAIYSFKIDFSFLFLIWFWSFKSPAAKRKGHIGMPFGCQSISHGVSVSRSVTLSCPLHSSWTLRSIFMKLHSYFPLSKTVCRAHDPATLSQGHRSRSKDLLLNFVPAPYLLNSFIDFHDLHSYVPLSKIMCRTYDSATQTSCQGHNSRSCD